MDATKNQACGAIWAESDISNSEWPSTSAVAVFSISTDSRDENQTIQPTSFVQYAESDSSFENETCPNLSTTSSQSSVEMLSVESSTNEGDNSSEDQARKDETRFETDHVTVRCSNVEARHGPWQGPKRQMENGAQGKRKKAGPHFVLRDRQPVLNYQCNCGQSCMAHFNLAEISQTISKHNRRSLPQRRAHLLHLMRNQQVWGSDTDSDSFFVRVLGRAVCQEAFRNVYHISSWMFQDLKQGLKSSALNFVSPHHGNIGKKKTTRRYLAAQSWMTEFVAIMGERLPHEPRTVIAAYKTKRAVHDLMVHEMKLQNYHKQQTACYEMFKRMLREQFPELKIGEALDMAYCATCSKLNLQRQQAANPADLRAAIEAKEKHVGHVKASRAQLLRVIGEAQRPQYDIDCYMIDGMDQSKTDLPYWVKKDKDTDAKLKFRTHITGGILYTDVDGGEQPMLFYDFLQVPKNPNLTIAVLMEMMLRKKTPFRRRAHIQLDNAVSENKNRYMFGFCASLVHFGIYDEVAILFCPVGHTHIEVDGLFSRVSFKAFSVDVLTLDDMVDQMKKCYTPEPSVQSIPTIFDVKTWVKKFIYTKFQKFWNYHYFLLRKDESGTVRLRYKYYFNTEWKPIGEGLAIFEKEPDMADIPEVVVPSLDNPETETSQKQKQVEIQKPSSEKSQPRKLKKQDLNSLRSNIPKEFLGRLPAKAAEWWTRFLNVEIEDQFLKVLEVQPSTWPLQHIFTRLQLEQQKAGAPILPVLEDEGAVMANTAGLKTVGIHVLGIGFDDIEIGPFRVTKTGDPEKIQKDFILVIIPSMSDVPDEALETLVELPYLAKAIENVDLSTKMISVSWLYSSSGGLKGTWKTRRTKITRQQLPISSILYWEKKILSNNTLSASLQNYVTQDMLLDIRTARTNSNFLDEENNLSDDDEEMHTNDA